MEIARVEDAQIDIIRAGSCLGLKAYGWEFLVYNKFHIVEWSRMANLLGCQLLFGICPGGINPLSFERNFCVRWLDSIGISQIQNLSNIHEFIFFSGHMFVRP